MYPIDDATLLSVLYDSNPWWKTKNVPIEKALKFKRRDFFFIQRNMMEDKNIVALIGPRQVGKTTLVYQLIENLLQNGIDPNRILFIAIDNPFIEIRSKAGFNRVIDTFLNRIVKEPISGLKERIYIFLDEITKYDGWAEHLKGFYDLKRTIKFFITDSSSSRITKGVSESLVGRVAIQRMMTLKFLDYISYQGIDVDLNKINWEMRDALQSAITKCTPSLLFDQLLSTRSELAPFENELHLFFNEYLLKDGYPELLTITSYERCRARLQDYLSLTLYKDVIKLFEVRQPSVLEDLLTMIADCSIQLVEFTTLAKNLSIKLDTLKTYLHYLEDIFLISLNEYYSKNRSLRIRKNRKAYVSNIALLNNILGQLDDSLFEDKSRVGRVVETLIMEHLKRLNYCLYPGKESKIFYWRDRKGHEVDLVIDTPKGPVPVEVKFRNRIDAEDYAGLNAFNRSHKCPLSLMITENTMMITNGTVLIPAWLFLLIC
jgi:uncharacterized protein